MLQILVIIVAVLTSVLAYLLLPSETMVPIHWNMQGEVDNYASLGFGVAIMPALLVVLAVLFKVLPKIDPKKANLQASNKALGHIVNTVFLVLLAAHFTIIFSSFGIALDVASIMIAAMSVLLLVIGNMLGKVRSNFFLGIRTPWTLSSEAVWYKTHRLGAKVFVAAGLFAPLSILLPLQWRAFGFLAIVLFAILYPIVMSWHFAQQKESE